MSAVIGGWPGTAGLEGRLLRQWAGDSGTTALVHRGILLLCGHLSSALKAFQLTESDPQRLSRGVFLT